MANGQVAYSCITSKSCPIRVGFACLEKIEEQYNRNGQPPKATRILQTVLQEVNGPGFDKIAHAQASLEEVKREALNITDKVLNNMKDIELTVEATKQLSSSANDFRRKSNEVKRGQIIIMLILFAIILLILFVIAVILIIFFIAFFLIVKKIVESTRSS